MMRSMNRSNKTLPGGSLDVIVRFNAWWLTERREDFGKAALLFCFVRICGRANNETSD